MNKAIISGFLCLGIIAADSGKAGELPVETFFKNYEYDQVRLSPDGNWLAALAPTRKKRVGLVVVDLEKRAAQFAYGDRTLDVAWFRWATTNRLLFGFSKDGYLERGFMAVNRDGSRPSQLVAIGSGGTQFLHLLPNSP